MDTLKQIVVLERGFLLRESDVMLVEYRQLLSTHFIYISCIPEKDTPKNMSVACYI